MVSVGYAYGLWDPLKAKWVATCACISSPPIWLILVRATLFRFAWDNMHFDPSFSSSQSHSSSMTSKMALDPIQYRGYLATPSMRTFFSWPGTKSDIMSRRPVWRWATSMSRSISLCPHFSLQDKETIIDSSGGSDPQEHGQSRVRTKLFGGRSKGLFIRGVGASLIHDVLDFQWLILRVYLTKKKDSAENIFNLRKLVAYFRDC